MRYTRPPLYRLLNTLILMLAIMVLAKVFHVFL